MEVSSNLNNCVLLLIDNDCQNLNIENINEIINRNFAHTDYVSINNKVTNKDTLINYLPIATTSNYLNLQDLSWKTIVEYSNVILVTEYNNISKSNSTKLLRILALFYRILTGKSINLILNSDLFHLSYYFQYYPFFLTVFTTVDCKKYELPEIEIIDDTSALKSILSEQLSSSITLNTPDTEINVLKYNQFFNYILNNGDNWKDFYKKYDNTEIKNESASICTLLDILNTTFKNKPEFEFYDAQYSFYPSLTKKYQVSILKSDENKIYVYDTNASDYNFRNLKFKNVLINTKTSNQNPIFVLPFYKDEQTTRQTVRFLIMNLYKVYNNSVIVDLIVLYLFMKVSTIKDTIIKTKYENIARLFLKRHGDKDKIKQFLLDNKNEIVLLKTKFKELNHFQDDDDLYELFDGFISSDFKLNNQDFFEKLEVVYVNLDDLDLCNTNENLLEPFPESNQEKSQTNKIEVNDQNWPTNLNYKCDESKLQFNSSLPFYICCQNFQEFLDKIEQIKWMKSIYKNTDKLVLKGGAILDILTNQKPKDYDFMNIGMSNEEFMEFLTKFIKETKPKSVEFVPNPVLLFRVEMEDGDLIEFILNLKIDNLNLFSGSYLPDQICFVPSENKLYANEYTLWALNYGYCELNLENFPRITRLSSKLNKLGFNFYLNQKFINKTKFLKERLERYVWSISQNKKGTPSYQKSTDEDKPEENKDYSCTISKEKYKRLFGNKIIFSNLQDFNDYIKLLTDKEKQDHAQSGLKVIEFNGAIILPDTKVIDYGISKGLDWSF